MTDHIEDSPIKKKNRGGRPPNSIWEDINKGEAVGSGKFAASCKYCKNTWSHGEVSKLEEHLSNHCPDAPAAVVRRYMTKVMERQDKSKSSKKRKYSEGQSNMDDYHDSTELNEQRCTRINHALVKFFIACGIAFRVVEHPFFINFIKELNAGYNTPTRKVLVNQLLECELAQVNFKVNSELEKETNLTLAFDEYLYQLSDLSENSHTAEYLVTVIEKVIEGIGEDRICAVVSNNVANVLNPHCIKVINERFDEFDDDKYITYFFMDPRFRNAPLKKCALMRIIKCAASIGKNLGFNRYEAETLCNQIQKYINEQEPFDLDISFAKDNSVNWWKYINTEPEPDALPRIASYLFAICPNSATCERGFSTLGWLFHKRRLNLNVDKLESMCKLILYWKSNSKTELGFYGIDQKKNTRLSDDKINIRIAEAFAEDDDEEYNEEQASTQRLTTSGETISEDNCRVVIENENNAEDDEVDDSGNNKRPGEGDYDYDIDDVLDMDDGDNNDDNYDDNEE
ncbi:ribonuclease H-like domain-containing protein [Rhizophagus irregularis DAOM 181602=DAOM 197198]|nr:ribonuclease H-like domain-containing protein [Rhizophagus irregularis DAOM 181602=DAOM 197198]